MKNIEKEQEEIDLSKTLIFILITLILTLFIASYMIIPHIQELKISKINADRSLAVLKTTRDYHDTLNEENRRLQEKNRKIIEALGTTFKEDRFYKFSEDKLGYFKIDSKSFAPHNDKFIKYELNATANISSTEFFYEYINSLNSYENLSEISFPVSIISKEDRSLDIKFNAKIYEVSQK